MAPGGFTAGRVAFTSCDGTLNPHGHTNGEQDAFVRHLRSGTVTPVVYVTVRDDRILRQ
ncbi:hypothetical protein ACFY0P_39420 [Streptomyces sp. NPDC001714]|uniref:hypothetical protein n=1 Tax=Streptomyces sp. NPDC001714 TaxID=3364603 RepID=UPI0036A6BBEC